MWTERVYQNSHIASRSTATRRSIVMYFLSALYRYFAGVLVSNSWESTVCRIPSEKNPKERQAPNLLSVWVWSVLIISAQCSFTNKVEFIKEKQEFFDDYHLHPLSKRIIGIEVLILVMIIYLFHKNSHFYKLFYSDRFSNLPLGVSPTGNVYLNYTTDTHTLPDDGQNSEGKSSITIENIHR